MGKGRTVRRRRQRAQERHEAACVPVVPPLTADDLMTFIGWIQSGERCGPLYEPLEHWQVAFSPVEVAEIERGRIAHG